MIKTYKLALILILVCTNFLFAQEKRNETSKSYILSSKAVDFIKNDNIIASYSHKKENLHFEDFLISDDRVLKDDIQVGEIKGRKLIVDNKTYFFRGNFMSFRKAKVLDKNSKKVYYEIVKNKKSLPTTLRVTEINVIENNQDIVEAWLYYQEAKWLVNKRDSLEAVAFGVSVGLGASLALLLN